MNTVIVFSATFHDKEFGALFVLPYVPWCSFMTNVHGWEGGKRSKGGQESVADTTRADVVLWFMHMFRLEVG